MKKKISLIGLVFLIIFSFTGCGSKASDTKQYDQATMQSYADMMVQSFSSMPEEALDQFADMSDFELNMMLMQSGLPIEATDFLSMVEAWKAGLKECGNIVEVGEYKPEETNSGAKLVAKTEFENRDGEISFVFDEKMNLNSMTVNANYSKGEILEKAGLNTILGMGTVFVVLIFISFIISLFRFIPALERKFSKKANKESAEITAAPSIANVIPDAVPDQAANDGELAAVIAAAIAAAEGTSVDGFVVRSINRRKTNKWN